MPQPIEGKSSRVKALIERFEETHGGLITNSRLKDPMTATSTPLLHGDLGSTLAMSRSEPFIFKDSPALQTDFKPKSLSPTRTNSDVRTNIINTDLIAENIKLNKLVIKLENKALERKNSLKEVFKLLSEKENELTQLKTNAKIEASLYKIKVEEVFKLAEEKLKDKYSILNDKLNQKEKKIADLEREINRIVSDQEEAIASNQSNQIEDAEFENPIKTDNNKKNVNKFAFTGESETIYSIYLSCSSHNNVSKSCKAA